MRWTALGVACFVLAGSARAGELPPGAGEAFGRAAAKLETPVHATPDGLLASVTTGLKVCERVEVEMRVLATGGVEVLAFPCLGGKRVDSSKAADAAALKEKIEAGDPALAPYAWGAGQDGILRARCEFKWDAAAPAALEGALLAAPAVDEATGGLLKALGAKPRLSEDEVAAKLRKAGTTGQVARNELLSELAPYLPELAVVAEPGTASFRKHVMNSRGVAFDAFRFRVPATGGQRRLVWSFALPPNTGKGWHISPVSGARPTFRNFHKPTKVEGTEVPAEDTVFLQRCETALEPGTEYLIWFQFKVETPVEMWIALACVPWSASDRDDIPTLGAALGLKAS